MEIFFLRHGDAEGSLYNTPEADFERELTDRGRERLATEATGLARIVPVFDLILTSPLVRARQSAEIFAQAFQCHDGIRISSALQPPCDLHYLLEEIAIAESAQRILCVGHAPSLGMLATEMISGLEEENFFELKKGGILQVTLEEPTPDADARLAGFFPPDFLITLGRGATERPGDFPAQRKIPPEKDFLPEPPMHQENRDLPEPRLRGGWDGSLSEIPDRRRDGQEMDHPYAGERDRRGRQYPVPSESEEDINEVLKDEVSSLQDALGSIMGKSDKNNSRRTMDALNSFLGETGGSPPRKNDTPYEYDDSVLPKGIDLQL